VWGLTEIIPFAPRRYVPSFHLAPQTQSAFARVALLWTSNCKRMEVSNGIRRKGWTAKRSENQVREISMTQALRRTGAA
jgi:hypothetical protein